VQRSVNEFQERSLLVRSDDAQLAKLRCAEPRADTRGCAGGRGYEVDGKKKEECGGEVEERWRGEKRRRWGAKKQLRF